MPGPRDAGKTGWDDSTGISLINAEWMRKQIDAEIAAAQFDRRMRGLALLGYFTDLFGTETNRWQRYYDIGSGKPERSQRTVHDMRWALYIYPYRVTIAPDVAYINDAEIDWQVSAHVGVWKLQHIGDKRIQSQSPIYDLMYSEKIHGLDNAAMEGVERVMDYLGVEICDPLRWYEEYRALQALGSIGEPQYKLTHPQQPELG